jgi:predicted nucleic acid-binding protein
MTVVVDTSVLIDHLRGDERARAALRSGRDRSERLMASILTKVEVLAGVRPDEEMLTRRLLGQLEWVPVDDEIAEQASTLAARFLRSHTGVETVDYVIAASARALGAELWTTNLRHFPMFPGLASPYEA